MSKLDDVYVESKQWVKALEKENNAPTVIRVWDGNWNYLDTIVGEYSHSFKFINNDAGDATLTLPLDHPSLDILNPEYWPTKAMYLTFDRNGGKVRWSGKIENYKVTTDYKEDQQVEITAVHDYQKLKELLVWSNPFLPAEVQFPKAWFLFGPSRWAVTVTLMMQLVRKNNSLWMVPDDPANPAQWVQLDQSNWNIVVKGVDFFDDNSLTAVVSSRFKYFHDCVKDICDDAQLSIEVRRYLKGEDPLPWPGANLRNGALVVDVQNKSGYADSTAFGGDLLTGLQHGIQRLSSDGFTEGIEWIKDPNIPSEYYTPGFMGSLPQAPWVTLVHGERTGIKSSTYEYTPPGPSQFVTGGSSMPGVNEGIKAAVIGLGGFLGSMFGQSQAGAVADAILEPLYSDVFMAFMAHKDHARIAQQGWDFPYEHWADGSDKAYTLSAITTLRQALYETREHHAVEVEMDNGCPYWVGTDFFIGDRVAVHAQGMPKNKLFVEQVEELEYTKSKDEDGWGITIGKPEFTSGLAYLAKRYERTTAGLKELGVW